MKTFEIRNKDKDLMIIDCWFDKYNEKFNYDINIFENDCDESFFTELYVDENRLKEIAKMFDFNIRSFKKLTKEQKIKLKNGTLLIGIMSRYRFLTY